MKLRKGLVIFAFIVIISLSLVSLIPFVKADESLTSTAKYMTTYGVRPGAWNDNDGECASGPVFNYCDNTQPNPVLDLGIASTCGGCRLGYYTGAGDDDACCWCGWGKYWTGTECIFPCKDDNGDGILEKAGSDVPDSVCGIGDPSSCDANMVSYWKFNEGQGILVADYKNRNYGEILGGTLYVAGKLGSALQFNGLNSYIRIPDSTSLDITGQMSVAVWVNMPNIPTAGNYRFIVAKAQSQNPIIINYELLSNGDLGGKFYFQANTVGGLKNVAWNTAPVANTWYFVVAVFDGSNMKISVNGGNFVVGSAASSLIADASNLNIGIRNVANPYPFSGLIDEVAIWNKALTIEEINYQYNSGSGRDYCTPPPAPPTCAELCAQNGKTCDTWTFGGQSCNCGTCTTPLQCCRDSAFCTTGTCVSCDSNADCDDANACTTDGCSAGTCSHTAIPPDCGTKICGPAPNGCGGANACGTCQSGYSCSNGACVEDCVDTCQSLNLVCGDQLICGANTNCGSCSGTTPICLTGHCYQCKYGDAISGDSLCQATFGSDGKTYFCSSDNICAANEQCYMKENEIPGYWDGISLDCSWPFSSNGNCKGKCEVKAGPNAGDICCNSGEECTSNGCAEIPWCVENFPNGYNDLLCTDYTSFGEAKCNEDLCGAQINERLVVGYFKVNYSSCDWNTENSTCFYNYTLNGISEFSCTRSSTAGECDAVTNKRHVSWTVTTEPSDISEESKTAAGCIAGESDFSCGETKLSFFGLIQFIAVLFVVFIFYFVKERKR